MAKQKPSSETTIAIAACVVAVLALFTSLWQGYVTRKHNRLSVTPAAHVDYFYYDGTTPGQDRSVRLEIANRGLGPGWLSPPEVYLDCDRVGVASAATWGEVIRRLGFADSPWEGDWFDERGAVPAGSSKLMLMIWPPDTLRYEEARKAVVDRIGLSFEMCSFYEECDKRNYNASGSEKCR